jgi:hypothetical protein
LKTTTRDDLKSTAARFGWQIISNGAVVVFRKPPFSIMVDHRRGDDSVLKAGLFEDAPPSTRLPPRLIEDVPARGYEDKHKRVNHWLLVYH